MGTVANCTVCLRDRYGQTAKGKPHLCKSCVAMASQVKQRQKQQEKLHNLIARNLVPYLSGANEDDYISPSKATAMTGLTPWQLRKVAVTDGLIAFAIKPARKDSAYIYLYYNTASLLEYFYAILDPRNPLYRHSLVRNNRPG